MSDGLPVPLVLLPGLLCDARLFAAQTAALSTARPVTVAPCRDGDTAQAMAGALLPRLPARFAVAGHGLGAVVAMEMTRRAPDRVAGLALICGFPLAEAPMVAAARDPRVAAARAGRLADMADREVPGQTLAPGAGRAAVQQTFRAMAQALGADVYARQSRALQRRADQQATLRRVSVPTLVLGGAHDTLAPVRRLEIAAALVRGARLTVLDDAGHLPPLETPEAVTDALATWLAGIAPCEAAP